MDFWMAERMADARRQQFMQEAENRRIMRDIVGERSMRAQMRRMVGEAMIQTGAWIAGRQEEYASSSRRLSSAR